jgi:hypothetical protein
VRLFASAGIEGERLQAISRAEFHPVASNENDEGRELNRRIEIRLRPRDKPIHADVEGVEQSKAGAAIESVPPTPRETPAVPKATEMSSGTSPESGGSEESSETREPAESESAPPEEESPPSDPS